MCRKICEELNKALARYGTVILPSRDPIRSESVTCTQKAPKLFIGKHYNHILYMLPPFQIIRCFSFFRYITFMIP
jgi:hypothetical protein